jgi:hypothetical protein
MAGEGICLARQMDVDPGHIAEFHPQTPSEGSTPSWGGRIGRFGLDMLDGAVRGDFVNEPSAGHITGQILAGLTPIGWVGDARDIVAGVKGIYQGKQGAWLNTGLAAVGVVPIVGEGAKALVRGGRAADEAAKAAKALKKAEKAEEASSRLAKDFPACFGAGTPVVTPSGERPIETIEEGDLVVSRDPETGAVEEHRIVRRYITPDHEVLDLGLEDGGRVEHLTVTPEHPFWSEGHGWTGAGELAPGDWVQTASGHAHVMSLQTLAKKITVYNFEVETAHTYFVGSTGAWVHNSCQQGRLSGQVGDEKRMIDANNRTSRASDLPIRGSGKLPETGKVLGKGEVVSVETYDRVASAAGNEVTVASKKVSLDKVETNVDRLRAGQPVEPVKYEKNPAGTPVIVEGYESWVAGQMTGKTPPLVEVPASGVKSWPPGTVQVF